MHRRRRSRLMLTNSTTPPPAIPVEPTLVTISGSLDDATQGVAYSDGLTADGPTQVTAGAADLLTYGLVWNGTSNLLVGTPL